MNTTQAFRRRGGLADPIRFVRQTRLGCMLACMAMVTGRRVAEVRREVPEPCGDHDMRRWLTQHNILVHDRVGLVYGWLQLVTVPSLNMPGKTHITVADLRDDRHRFYDPGAGRAGRKAVSLDDLQRGRVYPIQVQVLEDCRPPALVDEPSIIADKNLSMQPWIKEMFR